MAKVNDHNCQCEGKQQGDKDLERLRAFATPYAIQVSVTMVALGEALAIVIDHRDQAVLDELRVVCNELFDSAQEAMDSDRVKVQ